MMIPGVGMVTALAIVSVIGEFAASRAPASWSAISASIGGCGSPASALRGSGESAARGSPTRAAC
jgi:hypothetical protein